MATITVAASGGEDAAALPQPVAGRLLAVQPLRAALGKPMYDSRIGSSILLVTIIHATPSEAVMPSSRTMSMWRIA